MIETPTVLITGASRGIGAATASLLGNAGYAVCVNYLRDEAAAHDVVSALESAGAKCVAVQADVASEADVVRLFETAESTLGRISALVNNAGIVMPQTRIEHIDAERASRIFATNVIGTLLCCREAVRRMSVSRGGRGGAIVNLSSVAARTGSPGEYVDYAASKGAIDTLTRGLSAEVAADGIRVNCVRPGFIHTDMHASGGEPGRVDRLADSIPMRRGGTAEEVARAVGWLLSDEASYVTGAFIDVAGGR